LNPRMLPPEPSGLSIRPRRLANVYSLGIF